MLKVRSICLELNVDCLQKNVFTRENDRDCKNGF